MQAKLEQMFPSGQWGIGQKSWMVKDGTYFCAAAEIVDGEIVLTELGTSLLSQSEKPADTPAPLKSKAKMTGLKS